MPMMLLVVLFALPAQPQTRLSDDQIDQVITYARTAEGAGGARCYATSATGSRSGTGGGFAVLLEGPAGRIFDGVKAAQAAGRTFTRADVTPDMAATTLSVVAYPDAPKQDGAEWRYAPRATGIVIRAGRAQKVVVSPKRTETMPARWQSTSGATATGQGVRAVFSYEDFATMHLGDFEVVVLSTETERVCTIDATARASIR
jgi:hypothetical protein